MSEQNRIRPNQRHAPAMSGAQAKCDIELDLWVPVPNGPDQGLEQAPWKWERVAAFALPERCQGRELDAADHGQVAYMSFLAWLGVPHMIMEKFPLPVLRGLVNRKEDWSDQQARLPLANMRGFSHLVWRVRRIQTEGGIELPQH